MDGGALSDCADHQRHEQRHAQPAGQPRSGCGRHHGELAGFSVPVHRSLTEHILLGGAPRSIAILNGTLAAALGLGLRLWLVGLGLWALGHFAAVWAAKRDPQFVDVAGGDARRRANLKDPLAYRLMRQGLYLHIVNPPPSQPNGNTQVPPPPPDLPKRLELIDLLAQGPRTVELLALEADLSLANASRHLKQLRSVGLVRATKQGLYVEYRLADPEELHELGLQERRAEGAVLLIEWGRPYLEALGGDALRVEILVQEPDGGGEATHTARLTPTGERSEALARACHD